MSLRFYWMYVTFTHGTQILGIELDLVIIIIIMYGWNFTVMSNILDVTMFTGNNIIKIFKPFSCCQDDSFQLFLNSSESSLLTIELNEPINDNYLVSSRSCQYHASWM